METRHLQRFSRSSPVVAAFAKAALETAEVTHGDQDENGTPQRALPHARHAALDLLRDRKALTETHKGRERFTRRLHAARTARAAGHGIPLIEALEVVNAR